MPPRFFRIREQWIGATVLQDLCWRIAGGLCGGPGCTTLASAYLQSRETRFSPSGSSQSRLQTKPID